MRLNKNSYLIMGIETSCDETSVAIVKNGREILANIIASQIDLHKKFGGVVPEEASRKHVELINPVIQEALTSAGVSFDDLDGIGVSYGPGLVGALLVGVMTAKSLAYAKGIKLVGVNHVEAHMYANFLEYPWLEFPLICLVVSGGHSQIVYLAGHGEYELIGTTRDDAAGEAFDKVARVLNLGYPGGPAIDKLAREGNPKAIELPRARLKNDPYGFSFSGLKTAVLNYVNRCEQKGEKVHLPDLAASFQQAVIDVLVNNTVLAAKNYNVKTILLAGGVAVNSQLRSEMKEKAQAEGIGVLYPSPILCTDNAAMVACLAYYKMRQGKFAPWSLNATARLPLGKDLY
ncbi:MAG TPA: tRNA (adenosine(37)-N6)-threonylcarbamoyltransferase complex transferase subunit TsaD [Clostridia bacterium]|jgi:N6-L-threonylcarbamoyladenine synthase|nr:tRNA (adenosine(37)-N6)-threonylcarbamoyltransferase complex transferase subunit TsaD [Clostridia bacterium]